MSDEKLKRLFYNLDEPTAFSSHGPLVKASKQKSEQVSHFLEDQPVFSRHKQIRYKFPRRKTSGIFVFSHVQADLVEMKEFARNNSWHRYCLTMIDCYSRYAFVIPIKKKTGDNIMEALKSIFDSLNMYPAFLVTDKGKEFINSSVKAYLESRKINLIHPESEIKCAVVERFNRTWKTRLFKYLTKSNTNKWMYAGKKITAAINKSYHRMIKTTPERVFRGLDTPKDLDENESKNPKYKEAELVRLSRPDMPFRKGYRSGWTHESFQIVEALNGAPPTYRLVDLKGEEVTGIVYEHELVRAV